MCTTNYIVLNGIQLFNWIKQFKDTFWKTMSYNSINVSADNKKESTETFFCQASLKIGIHISE